MHSQIQPCMLATCCVPWTQSFDLDEKLFRRSIRYQLAGGLNNLYLFGTAGEGYAVTISQFEKISRVFIEETSASGGIRQLGIIALSIPQLQERIELGRAMGVNSFQLSLPSWGKLNDQEMALFFEHTCGKYPDCSFLFYNLTR